MAIIIKLGIFAVIGIVLAVQFKLVKPEFHLYIGIGIGMFLFAYVVQFLFALMDKISVLQEYLAGSEGYLHTLLKVIGITYICEFCAGICKDAGFLSVAGQIEVLGKLSVMLAGLPILLALMEQIQGFL